MRAYKRLFADRAAARVLPQLDAKLSSNTKIGAAVGAYVNLCSGYEMPGNADPPCRSGVLLHSQLAEAQLLAIPEAKDKLAFLDQLCDAIGHGPQQTGPGAKLLLAPSDAAGSLVVREPVAHTVASLARRALRFVGVHKGRVIAAQGLDEVEAFLRGLVDARGVHTTVDVAVFHGIILTLVHADPPLALEMAANPALPALNGTIATACARLVDNLDGPGMQSMLDMASRFAEKDERVVGAQTVATALAVRLRTFAWADETPAVAKRDASNVLKRLCAEFRVDPSLVFATSAYAIQDWAAHIARTSSGSLMGRAECVLERVLHQHTSLRPTTADALSAMCMYDFERPWLAHIIAKGAVHTQTAAVSNAALSDSQNEVLHSMTMQTILQDPKRWLVDARLLRPYAELLHKGYIACTDKSFAPFVEECGECYLEEHPEVLCFHIPERAGASFQTPEAQQQYLEQLAPASSYWTTLMRHRFDTAVHVLEHTDDTGAMTHSVRVALPRRHEALDHAAAHAAGPPPAIFEDNDIVAFHKCESLPVSRHALCCTQRGGAPMTDLMSVLMSSERYGAMSRNGVFRGGQLHRLDQDTTGVILYAKSERAMRCMRHQMGTSAEFGKFPKTYLALCVVLKDDLRSIQMSGVIKDSKDPRVVTRYAVVSFFAASRVALVECRIQQGKKHQIRRHLASMGMPILQDVEYGGSACTTPLVSRVALHATDIVFVHPVRQCVMSVAAAMPSDMTRAIDALKQSQS